MIIIDPNPDVGMGFFPNLPFTLTNITKHTPYVKKLHVQKTDTTLLLFAHPRDGQGGLLYHNIQSDFVSMEGCTNSLNKGPTGTSSSTIDSACMS